MISMTKDVFSQLMDEATNKGAKLQFDIGQLQQKLQDAEKELEDLRQQVLAKTVDKANSNIPKVAEVAGKIENANKS
jgi:peptidoglycan hydrolase CwlO-like protein